VSHKIVIQYVGDGVPQPLFRVIAYDLFTLQTFEPSEFSSLHQLLETLRAVFPDFEESWLSLRQLPGTYGTYIVFAGEKELNSTQLAMLGLKQR